MTLFDENLSRNCLSARIAMSSLQALGPPPKGLWRRRWTHPTRDAEFVLRRDAIRIAEFAGDPSLGLLVLNRR